MKLMNLLKTTYYKNCAEMPLINFKKYLETHDERFFTKEFKKGKKLNDVVAFFWNEYLEKTNNTDIIRRFQTIVKIETLQLKYKVCKMVLICLANFDSKKTNFEQFNELVSILEKNHYRINKTDSIYEQLAKINTRLNGINTQIELLKENLKDNDEKEAVNLESQIIKVSRALDLKYLIDINQITVLQWIEYQKQAFELNKQLKK